jgi:hypothetical protein
MCQSMSFCRAHPLWAALNPCPYVTAQGFFLLVRVGHVVSAKGGLQHGSELAIDSAPAGLPWHG